MWKFVVLSSILLVGVYGSFEEKKPVTICLNIFQKLFVNYEKNFNQDKPSYCFTTAPSPREYKAYKYPVKTVDLFKQHYPEIYKDMDTVSLDILNATIHRANMDMAEDLASMESYLGHSLESETGNTSHLEQQENQVNNIVKAQSEYKVVSENSNDHK